MFHDDHPDDSDFNELSISIFRRLSLFLVLLALHHHQHQAFQSPFSGDFLCFPLACEKINALSEAFQSPFSGDFLCFPTFRFTRVVHSLWLSISIFRRLSLFLLHAHVYDTFEHITFQSPFSGDFLCFHGLH